MKKINKQSQYQAILYQLLKFKADWSASLIVMLLYAYIWR